MLTVLFLVGTAGVTVWLWPRFSGGRARDYASRGGLVVAGQIFAAIFALVLVNKTMGPFYTSWADLFGGSVGAGQTFGDPVAADGPGMPPPKPLALYGHGTQPFKPYSGRFARTMFTGTSSQVTGEVDVYTPPQYDDPAYQNTRFPVVVLLHGVPGSNAGWLGSKSMNVEKQLEPLFTNGTVQPYVLVVPDIGSAANNTDCSDFPRQRRATWLAVDVPAMIAANFRVDTTPDKWAALGYSTGGFCAVKLALQYPQVFHYGVGIASDDFHGDPSVFGGNRMLRDENSPLMILQQLRRPIPVALYLLASRQDPVGKVAYAQQLAEAAKRAGVSAAGYIVPKGGHVPATWRQLVIPSFDWLSARMGPPTADVPSPGASPSIG